MGRHSAQLETGSPAFEPSGSVELVPTSYAAPDSEAPVSPDAPTYTPSAIPAYVAGPHRPGAALAQQRRRSRRPGRLLVIPLVLALAGLGGVVAVDKYVKSKLCAQIGTIATQSPGTARSGDQQPDLTAFQRDPATLRTSAKFLVVDGDLKRAVLGLADDAERWNTMSQTLKTAGNDQTLNLLPQILTLAGRLDVHVRDAQRACGQPVTGIPVNG